ncbi:MAG: hypothetical protein LQ340_004504 [Diploschistes diacapsis]|nr:MAG: hypothetical protein LQ340_004504 [Diploschistes diacapsis]
MIPEALRKIDKEAAGRRARAAMGRQLRNLKRNQRHVEKLKRRCRKFQKPLGRGERNGGAAHVLERLRTNEIHIREGFRAGLLTEEEAIQSVIEIKVRKDCLARKNTFRDHVEDFRDQTSVEEMELANYVEQAQAGEVPDADKIYEPGNGDGINKKPTIFDRPTH